MFVVIENTPGYLPDDDDSPVFADYGDAIEELERRLTDYRDDPDGNYRVVVGLASENNYAAAMVYDDDRMHDLGRSIQVVWDDESEEACS